MRTIDQMIQSEVLCCMSSIISTLAGGYGASIRTGSSEASRNLEGLTEQAFELASPIPDYEESAIQAGWSWDEPAGEYRLNETKDGTGFDAFVVADSWQALCEDQNIDPYDREVFERWAVTDWFADKLIEAGEKVDKDFGNLCIWARTTTGQGITSDGVIERIYAKTHQKEEA